MFSVILRFLRLSIMKYPVYNTSGEEVKQAELNPAIFGVKVKKELVHQVAMAQMNNARPVLAHTKDRSEVRGGGRKPWKQKGTGRARHGSTRSPLWAGGGVTFGPTKDRNFTQKINKKMKRKALFMCLSDRVKDSNLILLDKLELAAAKTREMDKLLRNLMDKTVANVGAGLTPAQNDAPAQNRATARVAPTPVQNSKKNSNQKLSVLVVGSKKVAELNRAGRNIPGVKATRADSLNVVDILGHRYLIIDEAGIEMIGKIYKQETRNREIEK